MSASCIGECNRQWGRWINSSMSRAKLGEKGEGSKLGYFCANGERCVKEYGLII